MACIKTYCYLLAQLVGVQGGTLSGHAPRPLPPCMQLACMVNHKSSIILIAEFDQDMTPSATELGDINIGKFEDII